MDVGLSKLSEANVVESFISDMNIPYAKSYDENLNTLPMPASFVTSSHNPNTQQQKRFQLT